MNQRGLVNSSMAQGAGVAAMIDRATPIAQQDAETYSNRAIANMREVNAANQFNVGQNNTLLGQGVNIAAEYARLKSQQEFQAAEAALDRANQVSLTDKSIAANKALQKAQQDFTTAENNLDRIQATTLQTNQQTYTSTQNQMDRWANAANTDKQIAANQALQTGQQTFASGQNALDRSAAASNLATQITANQALQTANQTFQAAQSALDQTAATDLATLQSNLATAAASTTFKANVAISTLNAINAVAVDGNLDATAKNAAIQNITNASNATLDYASTIYSTRVGK